MKFTDEELSLIMDAHESGKLARFGNIMLGHMCILMAGIGASEEITGNAWDMWTERCGGLGARNDIVNWFDTFYTRAWSTDKFLSQLEAQGWA